MDKAPMEVDDLARAEKVISNGTERSKTAGHRARLQRQGLQTQSAAAVLEQFERTLGAQIENLARLRKGLGLP